MSLDFIPIVPLAPVVVFGAVAAAAAAWGAWTVYRFRKNLLSGLSPLSIRLAAVAVFTLALAGPRSVGVKRVISERPVYVLTDASASMDHRSPGDGTRAAEAAKTYREVVSVLERTGAVVRPCFFGRGLYVWGGSPTEYTDVPPSGRNSSSPAAALEDIRSFGRPAAAAVISDGAWGVPGEVEFPVFTFAAGTEAAPGGYIRSATAPRYAFPGTSLPVEITVACDEDGPVKYSIYEGNTLITRGNATVTGGKAALTVPVVAETGGAHFYKIVSDGPGAPVWVATEVLTGPVKVYFRSTWADADSAFLIRAISSNAAVECFYRQDLGAGRVIETGRSFALSDADIIVIANPRRDSLDAGFLSELERAVADGSGLFVFFSAAPPDVGVLGAGTFGALSPLRPEEKATLLDGGKPTPTPESVSAGFKPGALPDFDCFFALGDPKASALPIWVNTGGRPVLSSMPYGRGKVVLLAANGLARWELSRAAIRPGLREFAGDLLLYLYGGKHGFSVSDRVLPVGARVEVYVESEEEPTVVVAEPKRESERVTPAEVAPGSWAGEWYPAAPGLYTLTVRRFSGTGLKVVKEEILVTEPVAEASAVVPATDNLRRLAELTGGKYYPHGPDGSFREEISEILAATGPPRTEKTAVPVFPLWLGVLLFVGLLVAEWVIRRLSGLA